MKDNWKVYPRIIDNMHALVTYNVSYAEIADKDKRQIYTCIRIPFKFLPENGFPATEENEELSALDDQLHDAFTELGSVHVGHITTDGNRYMYFYTDISEEQGKQVVNEVSDETGYQLDYVPVEDPEKSYYWNELYPTPDEHQMMTDGHVLMALEKFGDQKEKVREVEHMSIFPNKRSAKRFSDWIKKSENGLVFNEISKDGKKYMVHYSHLGPMDFDDIIQYSVSSDRKARELGGEYDGWFTCVENGGVRLSDEEIRNLTGNTDQTPLTIQ